MGTRHPFLAALAAAVLSVGALAQEEAEERSVYQIEAVTVTGSRIKSEESLSPAPIVVLSTEEIRARGLASIGDVLQTLTVQSNAINTQANSGGDGSTRISLRGLGSQRTLVLLNGRRYVAGGTGANGSVDLNSIPASVIERIEVLKDGASAVYGSDAVGGVVNIITRSGMEGLDVEVYEGISGAGDGEVRDVSVSYGVQSGKGHILFSASYHDREPVWTGDRSFSQTDKAYNWATNDGSFFKNGSSATPEGHIIDRLGEVGNEAWQALVAATDDAGDYHLDPDEGWRPFNRAGISSDGSGDLYNYQPENYLYTPQTRYSSFLGGSRSVGPDMTAFFEMLYTNRQSDQKLAPTPLFIHFEDISVSAGNRYNEFGRDFIDVRRRFVEASNRNYLQDIDTFRMVLGLNHKPLGYDGDLSFSYGRTEGTNVNEGRFIRSNLERALGPDEDCTGDCVPLDILHGAGTITPEMLSYIQYTGIARGYSRQRILQYNLTGDVTNLPAGALAAAVGASWRWEAGAYIPDPLTASGNTTGSKQAPTDGSYEVRDAYLETRVPVYGSEAVSLDLTAAARVFSYDTFGSGFTYEGGSHVQLPRGLALRATMSNAFRAPSIGEMFLGSTDSFPLVSDPCSTVDEAGTARELTEQQKRNCAARGVPADFEDSRAQLAAKLGGSADLDPEKADMFTAGIVYQPGFVDGLDLTADYYTATIMDEIAALGAGLILSNCYSQESPSHCDRVIRDDNHLIRQILNPADNIGETETSGVDLGIHHVADLPFGGILSTQLASNLLLDYDVTLPTAKPDSTVVVKGKGYYDLGVFPDWRHNASVTLAKARYSVGLSWRYVGGFRECEDDDCKGFYREDVEREPPSREVDANSTFNLHASCKLNTDLGESVLTVGINNLLDQPPAVIFNGFLGTSDSNTYDFLGRYMYVRLSFSR
ncbi:MAG: TonB-dependent receptor plug domain-containing protein [Gemmatimonadaceae bacterium]|nr:TonB-dependent receptor plug domain-containing protein [Gemmatimonadaceae bacterium]